MERLDLVFREKQTTCEIFVGFGLFEYLVNDLTQRPFANRLGIITDAKVQALAGNRLRQDLARSGIRVDVIVIRPGERSKRWETVQMIFEELIENGFDRGSGLIALGGGVVGDVTGFVASLYMRSIPYVQVPTTLLAQVDSSLGGKNGVDLPQGKNLLGTIYQPRRTYIDPSFLTSLPQNEFQNGLAEVIKSAIVGDSELFRFLERSHHALSEHRPKAMEEMVIRCCRIKSSVVMTDERDMGIRRILNFGHTVGHAIETCTNYLVPHGMAVSMGIAAETVLSTTMGILSHEEKKRILDLLEQYELPTWIPDTYDIEKLLDVMRLDKKAEDGRIAVVLPTAVGQATVEKGISTDLIRSALKEAQR